MTAGTISSSFFLTFFILRERVGTHTHAHTHTHTHGREREGERIPSRLYADNVEPDLGLKLTDCELVT